jgi:hypothetical protein
MRFLLHHRHEPHECGVVYAAFKASDSPLRHRAAMASCLYGDHQIWWEVKAQAAPEALAHLPPYVAARATATRVAEVHIP